MEDWVSKCGRARIMVGNCLRRLADLPGGSVHCCVTSPPYFGLRDYGHDEQLGNERRVEDYVNNLVDVFCEVRRVLRDDGVAWLNLGDSYNSNASNQQGLGGSATSMVGGGDPVIGRRNKQVDTLKPKDLIGVPWRVAFALQADGWYLRQDVIWAKPNPMPESVTDRCTKSHEYVFLLSKSARYYYDSEAVKEPATEDSAARLKRGVSDSHKNVSGAPGQTRHSLAMPRSRDENRYCDPTRNRRSVWTIATQPYKGAHFATYPPKLIEPCIKAGTSEEGCCSTCGAPWVRVVERTAMVLDRSSRTHELGRTRSSGTMVEPPTSKTIGWQPSCKCVGAHVVPCAVLDPFNGSGTTGDVSVRLGRQYVGCELNPDYVELAKRRIGTALRESARPLLDSR